jgi:hypothetical protein
VLAKFAGTHTVEVNQTGGVQQLRCIECHEYAFDELNSTVAQSVLKKHKNAAGNSTYTLSWLQRSLNNQTDEGICILCHGVIKAYENLSHTGVVMRVCTDINCHGNNETTNNTMYSAGNVGPVLGNTNAHEEWFDDMGSYLTRHQNESGANLTRDYYTCLGCHTYTEVDISISRANYDHSDPSYSKNRYI